MGNGLSEHSFLLCLGEINEPLNNGSNEKAELIFTNNRWV